MSPDPAAIPSADEWAERRDWFFRTDEERMGPAGYMVSEHACALAVEVERCFCAGAWIATVVLAASAVEAQLRNIEAPGYDGSAAKLIKNCGDSLGFHWLRTRRNELMHGLDERDTLLVTEDLATKAAAERDARRAIECLFDALYLTPSV